VRAWIKQRNFGIDVPINKPKMINDVCNVESHEKFVRREEKKRGDVSDDIGNVNYKTF
jgi:hypothetical protein